LRELRVGKVASLAMLKELANDNLFSIDIFIFVIFLGKFIKNNAENSFLINLD
jgi:hypothetical protein